MVASMREAPGARTDFFTFRVINSAMLSIGLVKMTFEIPDLDDDKQKFRDLMDLVSGTTYADTRSKSQMDVQRYTSATQKLTTIYFAISTENPYPAPKLCVYPANFAPDDGVIARGLDTWLNMYGWSDGGKLMEQQVKSVLYVLILTSLHL